MMQEKVCPDPLPAEFTDQAFGDFHFYRPGVHRALCPHCEPALDRIPIHLPDPQAGIFGSDKIAAPSGQGDGGFAYDIKVRIVGDMEFKRGPDKGVVRAVIDHLFVEHDRIGHDEPPPVPEFYDRVTWRDVLDRAVLVVDHYGISHPELPGKSHDIARNNILKQGACRDADQDGAACDKERD